MIKLIKILILIGVATIVLGIIYNGIKTEIANAETIVAISLKDSFIKYGASTTTAKNISDYFDKKKIYLSFAERDIWISVFNQAVKDTKIKKLKPFKNKQEMFSQMNEIIKKGAELKK